MRILIIALWFILLFGVFRTITDLVDEVWLKCFQQLSPEDKELMIQRIEADGMDATTLKL